MTENAVENSNLGGARELNSSPPAPDSSAIPIGRPKRGRPRLGEVRVRSGKLPKPPQMGMVPPLKFFRYWSDVDQQFPLRLKVFVYRRWPTIDRDRLGLVKNLDLLVVGDGEIKREDIHPEVAESTILHRYGSGSYKLMMNDGAEKDKHLMTCILEIRDPMYPPIIEPMDSLIMDDPTNRSFIEDCKRRGIQLPGEAPTEAQEEEEMAQVTTNLTGTIGTLVDRNMQMTQQVLDAATKREDRKDKEKDDKQPAQPQSADALQTSLNIVSTAAQMGTKIIESAVSKVGEIQAATANKENDPVKTIDGFLKLASAMGSGGGANAALIASLMENAKQAHIDERAAMKEQNELLRTMIMGRMQTPGLPPGSPGITGTGAEGLASMGVAPVAAQPKTFLDTLREFREIQELLSPNSGGDEEPSGGKSFWERNLPTVLQFAMIGANLIATSIHNLAVARSGQGQPVAPPAIQAGVQEQQDTTLPAPPPMMAQQTVQVPTDATVAAYHQFLATLKDPLLQSINNGESGYEFAEKLINWQGDMAYNFLRELGFEKMVQALSTYHPIWEFVSKIPNRFTVFLQEFLEYGEPEDVPPAGAPSATPSTATSAGSKTARRKAANGPGVAPAPVSGIMTQDPLSVDPGAPQAGKVLPKVTIS